MPKKNTTKSSRKNELKNVVKYNKAEHMIECETREKACRMACEFVCDLIKRGEGKGVLVDVIECSQKIFVVQAGDQHCMMFSYEN